MPCSHYFPWRDVIYALLTLPPVVTRGRYPVYWTMSVNDYYWASGDNVTFLGFVDDVRTILDRAAHKFWPSNPNLVRHPLPTSPWRQMARP